MNFNSYQHSSEIFLKNETPKSDQNDILRGPQFPTLREFIERNFRFIQKVKHHQDLENTGNCISYVPFTKMGQGKQFKVKSSLLA